MSIITRMLKGTCVYFANTGNDGDGGRTYSDGVEISCRWEDGVFLFTTDMGQEEKAKTIVYVPSDMSTGDYLYNGLLADLASPSVDPQVTANAREIKCFEKLPNLRYSEYLRTAYLK